jgi:hypothetical protein
MAMVLSCPNTRLRQEVSKRATAEVIGAACTRRPADALPPWFSLQQRLQATLDEGRPALALTTSECRVLNALPAALDPDGELAQLAEAVKQHGELR